MSNRSSRVAAETYPRTYRASGFWSFALYLCSGLIAAGSVAGLIYAAVGEPEPLNGRIVIASLSLVFLAMGIYVLMWLLKSRTVLYSDRIEFQGVFSTNTFTREDIKGWRVIPASPPTLALERRIGGSFKTSLTFPIDGELSAWFDSIPALDDAESEASQSAVQAEIEKDIRFGVNPSEKRETLERARKTAKILASVSTVCSIWAFAYPRPYEPLMLALILLPWVAIEIMRRSHGLFRADELKNDAHPSVAYALISPGIIVCGRAVLDYEVIQSLWSVALCLVVASMLFAAILLVDPSQRRRFGTLPLFFLFGVAYGYGAVVETNVLLDGSTGATYTAFVQKKEISDGRSTTYEIFLSPWGPERDTNELDVSRKTYGELQTGHQVQLRLKEGALGVRWYYLYDW